MDGIGARCGHEGARDDTAFGAAAGIAVDDAANAFICAGDAALLYASADGSTQWSFSQQSFSAISADVTIDSAGATGSLRWQESYGTCAGRECLVFR